jgi:hypothetical protein
MIRKNWLLCVLLGTLAWGQATPNAPPSQPSQAPAEQEAKPQAPAMPTPPPAPEDKSASVPSTAPVLTIEGVCPPESKTAAVEETVSRPATPIDGHVGRCEEARPGQDSRI